MEIRFLTYFRRSIASSIAAVAFLSHAAFASPAVYPIDGKVKGVFPDKPQPVGTSGIGKYKTKGFIATDEQNLIVYQASYLVGEVRYKSEDIAAALKNYAQGNALGHNALGHEARITHLSVGTVGKSPGAYYTIEYTYNGFPARIFNAVAYHNAKFLTWSVQDIPGLSKQDGLEVFRAYVKYFEPL